MFNFIIFVLFTFLTWSCVISFYNNVMYLVPPKWYETPEFRTAILFVVYIAASYLLLIHKRKNKRTLGS